MVGATVTVDTETTQRDCAVDAFNTSAVDVVSEAYRSNRAALQL